MQKSKRMRLFIFFMAQFLVFASGTVFANNLSGLIPTNPAYTAAWWKVWLSIGLALFFSFGAYCQIVLRDK